MTGDQPQQDAPAETASALAAVPQQEPASVASVAVPQHGVAAVPVAVSGMAVAVRAPAAACPAPAGAVPVSAGAVPVSAAARPGSAGALPQQPPAVDTVRAAVAWAFVSLIAHTPSSRVSPIFNNFK